MLSQTMYKPFRKKEIRYAIDSGTQKILKMDRPYGPRVISLTTFQAEGCGIALTVHSEHILKER